MILYPVASDVSNAGGWVGWTISAEFCEDAIQFPNLWSVLQDDGTQSFPYLASWCNATETPLSIEFNFGASPGTGTNHEVVITMTRNGGAGQEIYVTATIKQNGVSKGSGNGVVSVGAGRETVNIPIVASLTPGGAISVLFAFNLASGNPGETLSTELWQCALDASLVLPPVATSVVVTPATATVKVHGPAVLAQQQYTAVVYDQYGAEMPDEPVTWETDDEDIATIDANGLATGLEEGSVTITATAGAASDTAALVCAPFITVVVDPDEPPIIPDDPDPQAYDCAAIVPVTPSYTCKY